MSENPFGELPTPTHPPLDIMKLFEIAEELAEDLGDGKVTAEAVEAFAAKKGVREGEVYAASIFDPTLELAQTSDAKIEVCTGRCQLFGSIDLVDQLLDLRRTRLAAGKGGFDVVPRNCLDQCDFPPVLRSVTGAGTYDHRSVEPGMLGELITTTCDPS